MKTRLFAFLAVVVVSYALGQVAGALLEEKFKSAIQPDLQSLRADITALQAEVAELKAERAKPAQVPAVPGNSSQVNYLARDLEQVTAWALKPARRRRVSNVEVRYALHEG